MYVIKPTDDDNRSLYYTMKKEYRKLIKIKKKTFIDGIAADILQNNSLSWDTVKKLQSEICLQKSTLDTFDLERFYSFVKELYQEKQIEPPGKQSLQSHEKEQDENRAAVTSILNEPITLEELSRHVISLKNGKANGVDNMANEYLKASDDNLLRSVLVLSNECLDKGIYQ